MMTPWASERDLFVVILSVYFFPFEMFPALKFLSYSPLFFVLFLFFIIIQLLWFFFIMIYSLELGIVVIKKGCSCCAQSAD